MLTHYNNFISYFTMFMPFRRAANVTVNKVHIDSTDMTFSRETVLKLKWMSLHGNFIT